MLNKRIYIFSLALALFADTVLFGNWSWRNPLPTGNNLNRVVYAGSNTFLAAGEFGSVLRFVHSAGSWNMSLPQVSGIPGHNIGRGELMSIDIDEASGFGVTVGKLYRDHLSKHVAPTILRTSNHGSTWSIVNGFPGTQFLWRSLWDVKVLNSQRAFAVGDNAVVWYTNNQGFNWNRKSLADLDGGQNLILTTPGSEEKYIFYGIEFSSNLELGVLVGHGPLHIGNNPNTGDPIFENRNIMLVSNDQGSTWRNISLLETNSGAGKFFSFFSGTPTHLTLEGNECFVTLASGHGNIIVDNINFPALGDPEIEKGWHRPVPKTSDNLLLPGFASDDRLNLLFEVAFNNQGTGFIASEGGMYFESVGRDVTYDNLIWDMQLAGYDATRGEGLEDHQFYSLAFGDNDLGVMVGDKGAVLFTEDGGASWQKHDPGSRINLNDLAFLDADQGFAIGDFGILLHTSDGGASWQPKPNELPTQQNLNGIAFDEQRRTGLAVGDNGTVVEFKGYTPAPAAASRQGVWHSFSGPVRSHLNAVCFASDGDAFAVGARGRLMRKAPQGNWSELSWPASLPNRNTYHLYDVHFMSSQVGLAVGGRFNAGPAPTGNYSASDYGILYGGVILRTSNGGSTWTAVNVATYNDAPREVLRSVHFWDQNNGVAVGYEYTREVNEGNNWPASVLRSTDGGLSWERKNVQAFAHAGDASARLRYRLYDVKAIGSSAFLAVGAGGTLVRGDFSGSDALLYWQPSGTRWNMWALSGIPGAGNESKFITVGYGGTILGTENSGGIARRGLAEEEWSAAPADEEVIAGLRVYPNPLTTNTMLSFTLAYDVSLSIQVFDLMGRPVASVLDEIMRAGAHSLDVNAEGLAAGVYLLRLKAGRTTISSPLTVLK